MNYRHILTSALIAQHGLSTAHDALSADPANMSLRQLFIRHLILELGNVADIANISGVMYKDHPELGELQGGIRKGLEFFKYVRNIFVGHFVPDLTDKTFEWRPELNDIVSRDGVEPKVYLTMSALEAAINTYADPETGHKVFESDTDLIYPPDQTRFLNFLGDTVIGALRYLDSLIESARPLTGLPDFQANWVELAMKAGETDFSVLTKGRR